MASPLSWVEWEGGSQHTNVYSIGSELNRSPPAGASVAWPHRPVGGSRRGCHYLVQLFLTVPSPIRLSSRVESPVRCTPLSRRAASSARRNRLSSRVAPPIESNRSSYSRSPHSRWRCERSHGFETAKFGPPQLLHGVRRASATAGTTPACPNGTSSCSAKATLRSTASASGRARSMPIACIKRIACT